MIDDAEVHARRKVAVRWLEWACRGGEIRETDERYIGVTEGRDTGAMRGKYSSCGDLAHWMLYRVGIRNYWVNRDENRGWRVGSNISLLTWTAPAKMPGIGAQYDGGDIVIIWSRQDTRDAHAVCIIDRIGDTLLTAEYQTLLNNGQPGGALHERQIRAANGREYIGRRAIMSHLSLRDALMEAHDCGKLVAYEEPPDD